MNRVSLTIVLAIALISLPVLAQKRSKPWSEWSEKDAQRILEDSPWAHTQTDTDTSELFFSPTRAGTAEIARSAATRSPLSDQQSINNNRADRGATNQEIKTNYHIRFFSARPIRQALVRTVELQRQLSSEESLWLHKYAVLEAQNSIIITVTFDSNDQRFSGMAMQAFNSAVTGILKNNTYLERSDGKRLFLEEYISPGRDGFGARFVFPRTVGGLPFILTNVGEVRFYSELTSSIKLNMRFKVADMMYEGKLEY